jgi:hypothetical protein
MVADISSIVYYNGKAYLLGPDHLFGILEIEIFILHYKRPTRAFYHQLTQEKDIP